MLQQQSQQAVTDVQGLGVYFRPVVIASLTAHNPNGLRIIIHRPLYQGDCPGGLIFKDESRELHASQVLKNLQDAVVPFALQDLRPRIVYLFEFRKNPNEIIFAEHLRKFC